MVQDPSRKIISTMLKNSSSKTINSNVQGCPLKNNINKLNHLRICISFLFLYLISFLFIFLPFVMLMNFAKIVSRKIPTIFETLRSSLDGLYADSIRPLIDVLMVQIILYAHEKVARDCGIVSVFFTGHSSSAHH